MNEMSRREKKTTTIYVLDLCPDQIEKACSEVDL